MGLFLKQGWWTAAIVGAAVLSIASYLLFWNGRFHALPDQGGIGLLISLGILVVVLILK
jgi:acyl dehydratase